VYFFFLLSIILNVLISFLFFKACLSWYWAVIICTFMMSLSHEIEHDLFHELYFKNNKYVQKIIMLLITLHKLHISSFWRKGVHLRHHVKSGEEDDIEERILGLGDANLFRRLLALIHPFGTSIYAIILAKKFKEFSFFSALIHITPSLVIMHTIFILYFLPNNFITIDLAGTLFFCWAIPALVRHFFLTLITTLSHYQTDEKDRYKITKQVQVNDHPLYFIINIFTFNFGKTHALHHFYINDPFFIRLFYSKKLINKICETVPRNDFKVITNGNKYTYK